MKKYTVVYRFYDFENKEWSFMPFVNKPITLEQAENYILQIAKDHKEFAPECHILDFTKNRFAVEFPKENKSFQYFIGDAEKYCY